MGWYTVTVKTSNGYTLVFGQGNFDEYCVHVTRPNQKKWFPKDYEYLHWIRRLSRVYGDDKVYNDFLKVYDEAKFNYDEHNAYQIIQSIDSHYYGNTEHWWAVFYMTMVAEEHKENTILGKRIKRLGVYNVIYDGYSPKFTAEYMKNKDWIELDSLMIERGI